MITLYIKTHNVTGLRYFGQTSSDDTFKYKGSGSRWLKHIKKHGYDVSTEIYAQYDQKCFGLIRTALRFSRKNNIVKSKEWANLREENGIDGNPKGTKLNTKPRTKEHQDAINLALRGRTAHNKNVPMSEKQKEKLRGRKFTGEHKRNIGIVSKGRKHSEETKKNFSENRKGLKNSFYGKTHSEETKEKIRESNAAMVKCPHCLKEGKRIGMNRWHFTNCKFNKV